MGSTLLHERKDSRTLGRGLAKLNLPCTLRKLAKPTIPSLVNGKETPLLHQQHAVRKMPHIISMKTWCLVDAPLRISSITNLSIDPPLSYYQPTNQPTNQHVIKCILEILIPWTYFTHRHGCFCFVSSLQQCLHSIVVHHCNLSSLHPLNLPVFLKNWGAEHGGLLIVFQLTFLLIQFDRKRAR